MQRPDLICHMITSLDGRLLTERWPVTEAALLDLYDAAAERLDAGGWLVGRATMAHYLPARDPLPPLPAPDHPRPDRITDADGRRIGICIDPAGRLHPDSGTLDGDHLVIVLSDRVPDTHADALAARGVSVLFLGDGPGALAGLLARIGAAFGVTRLLLEGGGRTNGGFLAAGLIDETSTLVYPVLDGQGDVPCIYDHRGPTGARALELISSETLGSGCVWLRHRVVAGDRPGAEQGNGAGAGPGRGDGP